MLANFEGSFIWSDISRIGRIYRYEIRNAIKMMENMRRIMGTIFWVLISAVGLINPKEDNDKIITAMIASEKMEMCKKSVLRI